jgi:hypothetical protein
MTRPGSRQRHFPNSPPFVTGLSGLLVLLGAFAFWPRGIAATAEAEFHLFLGLVFVTMALVDALVFRTWRQPEAGIGCWGARPFDADRLMRKMAGLAAIAALVWMTYSLVPIYQDAWYGRFTGLLVRNAGLILALAAAYVIAMDRLLADPSDALEQLGLWLLSLGAEGDTDRIAGLLMAWLVKLFFLPLMYCYGLDDWTFFYTGPHVVQSFTQVYELAYRFLFFVDVTFAILGYALSLRLFGGHVRWPEPTARGWLVCVMCYAPFWQVIGRNYLSYDDSIVWGTLFADWPLVYGLWGSTILLLLCVYVLSTVAFGLRFSNLTYRGTIHRGPYALTRHPAYVSKNLTMWMVQLPFLAAQPSDALGNTLALIGVNLIYLCRARHEEACCRRSREYRIYERHMRRFGPLARAVRALRGRRRGATRWHEQPGMARI